MGETADDEECDVARIPLDPPRSPVPDAVPGAFDRHRRLLFTVAYQMLGSVADAEDVVQDAWLRWSAADRTHVADPKAYLVRVTSRLALDRLGAVRARRETYVGPWLPDPLLTDDARVRRRRPSSASRCPWPCSSSWRRSPLPSGRSSCCARCSR
jgi:hypothetical protein